MKRTSALFIIVVAVTVVSRSAHADETPEPADTSTAPPPRPQKPWPVAGLRVDGGHAWRELVSLPLTGAAVGFAAGAQLSRSLALWGTTRVFFGSTASGLDVRSASFGSDAELVLGRLRLGAGFHAFVVGVDRVPRNKTILSWGPGVGASARFDLIEADGFAIFARAAIDASYEVYNDSIFWGPTLGGGVDFHLGSKRASLR
jgi:hypothetical protein